MVAMTPPKMAIKISQFFFTSSTIFSSCSLTLRCICNEKNTNRLNRLRITQYTTSTETFSIAPFRPFSEFILGIFRICIITHFVYVYECVCVSWCEMTTTMKKRTLEWALFLSFPKLSISLVSALRMYVCAADKSQMHSVRMKNGTILISLYCEYNITTAVQLHNLLM